MTKIERSELNVERGTFKSVTSVCPSTLPVPEIVVDPRVPPLRLSMRIDTLITETESISRSIPDTTLLRLIVFEPEIEVPGVFTVKLALSGEPSNRRGFVASSQLARRIGAHIALRDKNHLRNA
jgi:hypothetical protein